MEEKIDVHDDRDSAWVVSVIMGLGHIRAAYPLRDIAAENIIIDGTKRFCPRNEYQIWQRMRNFYYLLSRAMGNSVIGTYALCTLMRIEPYYPVRDLSKSNWAVKYLGFMIRNRGMCRTLIEKIKTRDIPVINTFYATAMAVDAAGVRPETNYLMICDADINRIWVSEHPHRSTLKYLAPCTQVKRRLLSYGVPEDRIFLTGFPLPKENIGDPVKLDVLKEDLFARLLRLDPKDKFFNVHEKDVLRFLGKDAVPERRDDYFVLSFAVGGAGAQMDLAGRILRSLQYKIREGRIRVNLSAGIDEQVASRFREYVWSLGLSEFLDNGISIIYDRNVYAYIDKFAAMLRTTDVLWTKPSELSFYCALGVPILIAPPVGAHEEYNRTWLQEIHAGVQPAGPLEHVDQWLFDLRENGRLAEAAWDGFLKARKLGTFKIEELVRTGKCTLGESPLEQ